MNPAPGSALFPGVRIPKNIGSGAPPGDGIRRGRLVPGRAVIDDDLLEEHLVAAGNHGEGACGDVPVQSSCHSAPSVVASPAYRHFPSLEREFDPRHTIGR
jgi:hypothetical protein